MLIGTAALMLNAVLSFERIERDNLIARLYEAVRQYHTGSLSNEMFCGTSAGGFFKAYPNVSYLQQLC